MLFNSFKILFNKNYSALREHFLNFLDKKTWKNNNLKDVYLCCEDLHKNTPSLSLKLKALFLISLVLNILSAVFLSTHQLEFHFVTKMLGRTILLICLILVFLTNKNYYKKVLEQNNRSVSFNFVVLQFILVNSFIRLIFTCFGILFSCFIWYQMIYLDEEIARLDQALEIINKERKLLKEILELLEDDPIDD